MTVPQYLARICLCGQPRSRHAYAYTLAGGEITMRILPLSDWTSDPSCAGFVDAIEREMGYPAQPTGRTLPAVDPDHTDDDQTDRIGGN